MRSAKTARRALTLSAVAMLLCVAMLVGTTFAWFTDSAAAGVSIIQAGTLEVELLDENGSAITSLSWQNGATTWDKDTDYSLQSFKIHNKGDLALKYEVRITESEMITWSGLPATGVLKAGATSDTITISGKLNNDHATEGATVDNIKITVLATQAASEFDSTGNDYDSGATYPLSPTDEFCALVESGASSIVLEENIDLSEKSYFDFSKPLTVDLNGNTMNSAYELGVFSGGDVTFSGGTIQQPDGPMDEWNSNPTALMLYGGSVTLENATITAADHSSATSINPKTAIGLFSQEGETATVTIKSGTLVNGDIEVFAPMSDANEDGTFGFGKSVLIIEGGTFNFSYGTGLMVYLTSSNEKGEQVAVPEDSITVQISGGTFKGLDGTKEVLEQYLVDGYTLFEEADADGTTWYTVVLDETQVGSGE